MPANHRTPRLARRLLTAGAAAACLLAATVPAQAQAAYPNKPITLVVGYPAGGSVDLTARLLGPELASRLNVPVVIENVSGAGGVIGAQKVANAPPDGYTLLVGANNELAISKLITSTVRYSLKDFSALGIISTQPIVLVAAPKTGVTTTEGFLELVRRNPGKFSYGSSGVGTALHLAGEMVKQQAGVYMTHIPYRGVAPLTSDIIGGNIEFGMFVMSSGLPHIKSGKVVALGSTQARRFPLTPDIPALAEAPQLKGLDIGIWFALVGPAKLPEPVAAKLRQALDDSLRSPDFRKKMEAASSVLAEPGIDAAKYMQDEAAKYQKIVQFANIKEE